MWIYLPPQLIHLTNLFITVPLRRIVWQQTAGWRRFPQWFLSWWSADTGVLGGFHNKRWPGPTGLQHNTQTHTQCQKKQNILLHTLRTYLTVAFILTNGILRRKVNSVRVKKLQEGPVDGIRELANLYHFLLILRPLGAKHWTEMLAPSRDKNTLFTMYTNGQIVKTWHVKGCQQKSQAALTALKQSTATKCIKAIFHL